MESARAAFTEVAMSVSHEQAAMAHGAVSPIWTAALWRVFPVTRSPSRLVLLDIRKLPIRPLSG